MLNKGIKDKLYAYFINRWGMFDYTRGWLKGNCPDCGAENKFGVNLSTNRTHCFRCEYVESPIRVVAQIEQIEWGEVIRFLKNVEGLEYKEPDIIEYTRKEVPLPKGFKLLGEGDSQLQKITWNYIKGRGLDPKKLSRKGFGYCDEGPLFGYLVFPYYVNGVFSYYSTRRVLSVGPKFNNPKLEEFGLGKSSLIYNIDALHYYKTIYIAESVLNAETLGDNAIGLSGKAISGWQLSALLKSQCSNVVIILDPDAYGYAIKLGMQLINYKRVKVINLPEGQDINSFGRTKTLVRVRRERYQTYKHLMQLKNAYQGSLHSHN